jgi:probable F420-dependent oxidoreductase
MSALGRLALTLPSPFHDARACVELAKQAEQEWGYEAIWMAETAGPDSFALAGAMACATSRIEIGTAIVPVYNRTPAVLAMGAGTLAQLSGDRFVLGLGSSSHAIIGDWNGIDFEAPLGHVAESVAILRQALAGQKTDFAGRHFRSKGFRLASPPKQPMRIYLAALREQMLRLAGGIGEGLIINFQPASAMPQILAAYRAGGAAAGRDASRDEVVCRFQVCVTDDRARARGLVRLGFGAYLATPVYNAYLDWCGFPNEAKAIREAFARRDRQAVAAAIPDELVDRIAILGTEDECRAQLAEFVAAGVTTPVLAPLATNPADAERIYAAFAPARGRA